MVRAKVIAAGVVLAPIEAVLNATASRISGDTAATLLAASSRLGGHATVAKVLLRRSHRLLCQPQLNRRWFDVARVLLEDEELSTKDATDLHYVLGMAEARVGDQNAALRDLHAACAAQPDNGEWRLELLKAAANCADIDTFYGHLSDEATGIVSSAEFGVLLATLGDACTAAKDWRGAADAYHHAFVVDRTTRGRKADFLRARRLAPDWGFYSHDPNRIWSLGRRAARVGVAAPARAALFGWLPADGDKEVVIKLNGAVVAKTHAREPTTLPDGNRYLQFSRRLNDVWKLAGADDTLTIEANGHRLRIIGRGQHYRFKGESKVHELFAKLDDGYVLNKYGRLRPSIKSDLDWQDDIFELYRKLRRDVAHDLGLTIFPFYGTALGAVREHDFIGHDNDFDTVYISKHSDPGAVSREFKELCAYLVTRGYDLSVRPTHTWVMRPGTTDKLDIFFAWFTPAGYFDVSYGYHGSPVKLSPEFTEFRMKKLGRFEIPLPRNIEDVLCQLYGADWRIPDPGFSHFARTLTIDERYQLDIGDVTELHWDQFYRDHQLTQSSRFAEFVATRFSTPGTVLEFGCGSGRDAALFAQLGWKVHGGDRSAMAVSQARSVLQESGRYLPARFVTVDVASADSIRAFVQAMSDQIASPLVVYLRFFLHAIDENSQVTLLDTLTAELATPFYLCAEFRTTEDRELEKHHGDHFRRYLDHDEFVGQLRDRWKFEIEHVEAGQGLSPYDGEDPHLARVIARHLDTRDDLRRQAGAIAS